MNFEQILHLREQANRKHAEHERVKRKREDNARLMSFCAHAMVAQVNAPLIAFAEVLRGDS